MNPQTLTAAMLALAAVLATVRLSLRLKRSASDLRHGDARRRTWAIAVLLIAQPLCAWLLYRMLWPPEAPRQAGTMVVATVGATQAQLALAPGDIAIALPEAAQLAGVDRAPDLATALRRHPEATRLRIVGDGLEARDRPSASTMAVNYRAPALPRGLVEVWPPDTIAVGASFRVSGRVHAIDGGAVEWLDPAGRRVDRQPLAADGRFTVSATARGAGVATFLLRVLDKDRRPVETADVPLRIVAEPALRLFVLAGAPGPEWKYLRRWAIDSGIQLRTQMTAGAGLQLAEPPLILNAANLSRFDAIVLDERAWESLGDAQRTGLIDALREGLGIVLRATGPLSERTRAQWRALGIAVDAGSTSTAARLVPGSPDSDATRLGTGSADAPRSHADPVPALPTLTRRVLRMDGAALQVPVRDAAGAPLLAWTPQGRGRIALWTLTDTFKLVLSGRADVHADLWSTALAAVARPKTVPSILIDSPAWADQRLSLCGLASDARVIAPTGTTTPLRIDPVAGSRRCAAFWPRTAGWHSVDQGEVSQPFYVRDKNALPGVRARLLREANQRLAMDAGRRTRASAAVAAGAGEPRRGSSWPWFSAWLAVMASVWWLERARAGRRDRSAVRH